MTASSRTPNDSTVGHQTTRVFSTAPRMLEA